MSVLCHSDGCDGGGGGDDFAGGACDVSASKEGRRDKPRLRSSAVCGLGRRLWTLLQWMGQMKERGRTTTEQRIITATAAKAKVYRKLGRRDDENQKRSSVVKFVGGTDEIKQALGDTSSYPRFSFVSLLAIRCYDM